LKKKNKLNALDNTSPAVQPYSKSHGKRLKKKAKEQAVVGDLTPVRQALEEVLASSSAVLAPSHHHPIPSDLVPHLHKQPTLKNPTISKKSISHKQKAKLLLSSDPSNLFLALFFSLTHHLSRALMAFFRHEEATRLPSILKHPEFRKNPFAAIRTHLQNSSSVKPS
jgi:hypothetical protein